eukprot:1161740-Pelagomonas_calceolata.AAC.12
MTFTTLPDSSCGHTLSKLNGLLGSIVLLRSVIPVILMTYKMKNMCCSDVPIPRSALSVKSMPHILSTTSLFYTSTSPTGCPVYASFTIWVSLPGIRHKKTEPRRLRSAQSILLLLLLECTCTSPDPHELSLTGSELSLAEPHGNDCCNEQNESAVEGCYWA